MPRYRHQTCHLGTERYERLFHYPGRAACASSLRKLSLSYPMRLFTGYNVSFCPFRNAVTHLCQRINASYVVLVLSRSKTQKPVRTECRPSTASIALSILCLLLLKGTTRRMKTCLTVVFSLRKHRAIPNTKQGSAPEYKMHARLHLSNTHLTTHFPFHLPCLLFLVTNAHFSLGPRSVVPLSLVT